MIRMNEDERACQTDTLGIAASYTVTLSQVLSSFRFFLFGVVIGTTITSSVGVASRDSPLMGVALLLFFFFFPVVRAPGVKCPTSPPIVASLQSRDEGQMFLLRQSPQ